MYRSILYVNFSFISLVQSSICHTWDFCSDRATKVTEKENIERIANVVCPPYPLSGKNPLSSFWQPPLFYKKIHLDQPRFVKNSHNNDPPILTQKQPKVAIFDRNDFLDLKYPPEVRVEPKTCSNICGTPVQAILNHKNFTG